MSLKGKRLLILGGSKISCEIVKQAQKMGIYTMVTDWYSAELSPAKGLADKSFNVSTSDIKAMLELIKKEKIDGLITGFTDSVLPYYAEICEAAGLPHYGTKDQFEILVNKNRYKKICKDFNVPVIEEYNYKNLRDENKLEQIQFPVLVKPADNSGGRGITICENAESLADGYEKALNYSEKKEVLVEKYLTGKEVTIFYTIQDGEIILSAMGDRHVKKNQEDVIALPVAYTFPSVQLENYQRTVDIQVKKMLKSLDIKDGMIFMQCIVENNKCVVYDIGFRLTGSLEYKLIDEVCGFNPLEMLIRFALTGKMDEKEIKNIANPSWPKYGCNISFLVKPGVIEKISGIEEIMAMPEVLDAVQARTIGEEIPESAKGTLKQIVLRVFATSSNKEELIEVLDKVYESLTVTSNTGENMLLKGFNTEELRGITV